MSRFAYLAREALYSLSRNMLVVLGAILAVFISLGLAFGALAVNELVRVNTLAWQDGTHVVAFLNDSNGGGVPSDAHETLLADVQGWDEVQRVNYVDKGGAWAEFQQLFADQPDMLEAADPAELPASLRIELTDIELYQSVEVKLAQESQVVRKVSSFGENIEQLSNISTVLNFLGIGLSVVLGVSAVVLIANTIRLAIYARRDEISIMKLVGASNWFVRVPFLLEGLIEGLVGAALAVFSLWVVFNVFSDTFAGVEIVTLTLSNAFFLRWGAIFLLFGAAAGVLGSLLGLSRYLREREAGPSMEASQVPELV